jgi:hypothetical protein
MALNAGIITVTLGMIWVEEVDKEEDGGERVESCYRTNPGEDGPYF